VRLIYPSAAKAFIATIVVPAGSGSKKAAPHVIVKYNPLLL